MNKITLDLTHLLAVDAEHTRRKQNAKIVSGAKLKRIGTAYTRSVLQSMVDGVTFVWPAKLKF